LEDFQKKKQAIGKADYSSSVKKLFTGIKFPNMVTFTSQGTLLEFYGKG